MVQVAARKRLARGMDVARVPTPFFSADGVALEITRCNVAICNQTGSFVIKPRRRLIENDRSLGENEEFQQA